jgi:hypothetical protein
MEMEDSSSSAAGTAPSIEVQENFQTDRVASHSVEITQPGSDNDGIVNPLGEMKKEEIPSAAGAPDFEASEPDVALKAETENLVVAATPNISTSDGWEKAVSAEVTEHKASSLDDRNEVGDPNSEPEMAPAATASTAKNTPTPDGEAQEIVMIAGPVDEDDGGSTVGTPLVEDVSGSPAADCCGSMDDPDGPETKEPARDPSEHILEPANSSSVAQSRTKATGSPLKGPFRTPKFSPQKHRKQQQQPFHGPSLILSLPIDSLHSIASFLSPLEWTHFGQCDRGTNKICNEIFRRVRMHGFRCATEVITAWVSNEAEI